MPPPTPPQDAQGATVACLTHSIGLITCISIYFPLFPGGKDSCDALAPLGCLG